MQNHWNVERSSAGRPFAKLTGRETQIFDGDRPAEVSAKPERHDSADGELLSECNETFQTDEYGNVFWHDQVCGLVEETLTGTTFSPQPGPWLISNPLSKTVVGRRLFDQDKARAWSYGYDALGQVTSVTRSPEDNPNVPSDPSARHTTTYVRNPTTGNIEQVIESVASGEPARSTTITYDVDGIFPRTITNNLGHLTTLVFDERWGVPKTVVDQNGIVVQRVYDGLGLFAETHGPTGTTLYTYAALPNVGVETSVGRIEPRIVVSTAHQGIDGTPLAGEVVELDHLGRVVRQTTTGFGNVELIEERAYLPLGQVAAATAPHTADATIIPTTTFTYDDQQRLTHTTRSDGSVVEYQYASTNTLAPQFEHWLLAMGGESPYAPPAEVRRTIDEDGREDVIVTDYGGKILRNIDGEHAALTDRFTGYFYGPFGHV